MFHTAVKYLHISANLKDVFLVGTEHMIQIHFFFNNSGILVLINRHETITKILTVLIPNLPDKFRCILTTNG